MQDGQHGDNVLPGIDGPFYEHSQRMNQSSNQIKCQKRQSVDSNQPDSYLFNDSHKNLLQSSEAGQIEVIVNNSGAANNVSCAKAPKSTNVKRLQETEKAGSHKPEEMKNVNKFKNKGSKPEAEKNDQKEVFKGPWMDVQGLLDFDEAYEINTEARLSIEALRKFEKEAKDYMAS